MSNALNYIKDIDEQIVPEVMKFMSMAHPYNAADFDGTFKDADPVLSWKSGIKMAFDQNLAKAAISLVSATSSSGKQDRRYVCRKCLNSYTNQLEKLTHKRLCGNNDKSVYTPCKETHVKWDKQYQNVPLYSKSIADFEARNEPIFDPDKDQCKTIDICKQVPCNGFYTINK